MESPDLAPLLHFWWDFTVLLVPRLCVMVVAAFACIRLPWVRRALRGLEATSWTHRLSLMLAFGFFGVVGTHGGILVNVGREAVTVADWPADVFLNKNQAIVGFRDTMVLAGGLIGGPWVGLGAGLLAGFERYWLGGFAALAGASATVVLGLVAGWARHRRPHGATTPYGAFIVALFCTALHRCFVQFFAGPDYSMVLSLHIVIPVAVLNCPGCVLFIWVMRDLDKDKLEAELRKEQLMKQEADLRTRLAEQRETEAHLLKQQAELREQEAQSLKEKAELRALRAQVEPHFLNNTLNAIRWLIRSDPDKAREYVVKLAKFFETTRKSASANTITLREELDQLKRYLDFQHLRFGEKFHYRPANIPSDLLDCQLPPHSLLTLAENALACGVRGRRAEGLVLRVAVVDLGDCFEVAVADDGCGIAPERLAKLGKEPVDSPHSNGTALYQLTQSLELTFRGRAGLAIASELGAGTEVTLTLPKEP